MAQFEGKTALIIEDDAMSIKVMEQLLKQSGVTSVSIKGGANVAAILNNLETPDVVFLDLEMPEVNGYRVYEMLRQHEAFATVPVVAYTTHISHLKEVREAGFSGFLGKPLDNRRFPELLEKILAGESVWEVPS